MKYYEEKMRVLWRTVGGVIEEAWQIFGGRTFQKEKSAGAKTPRGGRGLDGFHHRGRLRWKVSGETVTFILSEVGIHW